jgi:hypothetical protein
MTSGSMEPFALIEFLLGLLPRSVRAIRRGCRYIAFRWRERQPPLDQKAALNAAFSVLAGRIEQCIPFRSIDSKRTLLAVVRDDAAHAAKEIHLLEQFGMTFRRVWSAERLDGLRNFLVEDVDDDRNKEIVFEQSSCGTGGGTKTLSVYSHSKQQLVRISEWLYWANAAGPISPEVKIESEPAGAEDEHLVGALERYAVKSGFLTQALVDFENPEFAAARWHVDNGDDPKEGPIKLSFYRGRPCFSASISQRVSGGGIEWTAFFKGPIFGYNEEKDEHFVAYSPAWTYNWAIAAVYCYGALWFVRHNESEPRLYRFRLDGAEGFLDSCPIPGNPVLLQKIEWQRDGILVNDGIFVPFSNMRH